MGNNEMNNKWKKLRPYSTEGAFLFWSLKGVKEIFVDGEIINGNVLPISTEKECNVKIIMG